jgi:hypothetical protein
MTTISEYFYRDHLGKTQLIHEVPVTRPEDGSRSGTITAQLKLDYDTNAAFISYYVPDIPGGVDYVQLLNSIPQVARMNQLVDATNTVGDDVRNIKDLKFTGLVYIYSEIPVPPAFREIVTAHGRKTGCILKFRSENYVQERIKTEKALAFISHDSRDKAEIAEPLVHRLQYLKRTVWYDRYALKVGDSLRESIESGLKECRKCILILTPNFLNNNGWTKVEYDSIFTRELIENQKSILPIWHNVTQKDVYKYSPVLANTVALNFSAGVDNVARDLARAIDGGAQG